MQIKIEELMLVLGSRVAFAAWDYVAEYGRENTAEMLRGLADEIESGRLEAILRREIGGAAGAGGGQRWQS
jgi:hypothetical protein